MAVVGWKNFLQDGGETNFKLTAITSHIVICTCKENFPIVTSAFLNPRPTTFREMCLIDGFRNRATRRHWPGMPSSCVVQDDVASSAGADKWRLLSRRQQGNKSKCILLTLISICPQERLVVLPIRGNGSLVLPLDVGRRGHLLRRPCAQEPSGHPNRRPRHGSLLTGSW